MLDMLSLQISKKLSSSAFLSVALVVCPRLEGLTELLVTVEVFAAAFDQHEESQLVPDLHHPHQTEPFPVQILLLCLMLLPHFWSLTFNPSSKLVSLGQPTSPAVMSF